MLVCLQNSNTYFTIPKKSHCKAGVPTINFLFPYLQEKRKSSVISGEVLCHKSQSVWVYRRRFQIVTVFSIRQQNPKRRIKMKCACLHWKYLLQNRTHVLDFPWSGVIKSRFDFCLENIFENKVTVQGNPAFLKIHFIRGMGEGRFRRVRGASKTKMNIHVFFIFLQTSSNKIKNTHN